MIEINYYEILGVSESASSEIIHAAFRTLMCKLKKHPDLGGDEDEAKLINEAYQVLRDPRTRSEYDALKGSKSASEVAKGVERRRARRRPSLSNVSFCLEHDYQWCPATLKDISELGLRFKTHTPLVKGQEITISWTNGACQVVKGVVRWARMFHPTVFERVYEAGIEFFEPVNDIDSRVIL